MKNLLFFFLILETLQKSDVYFTKYITSSKMVEMLKKLNIKLTGKVGLKIHSGEPGGLYFLKPDFLQEIYDYTTGDFLECNTLLHINNFYNKMDGQTKGEIQLFWMKILKMIFN